MSLRAVSKPGFASLGWAFLGAVLGVWIWAYATAASGQYRAFLALVPALGVTMGLRLGGHHGKTARRIGLGFTAIAIVFGQYLALSVLCHDLARRAGNALTTRVVPMDLLVAAWRQIGEPVRECVFFATSLALVAWLLGTTAATPATSETLPEEVPRTRDRDPRSGA